MRRRRPAAESRETVAGKEAEDDAARIAGLVDSAMLAGIWTGTVEAVLGRGWRAVVTARKVDKVRDLGSRNEANALALTLDVTDKAQIEAAVKDAERKFGRMDVLVKNAGYGYLAAVEEGEDEAVRKMFETNFFGLVALTKAVLPAMRARRAGHLVNLSSIGGLVSCGPTGYYHATKYAVEGISESLAIELKPLGIKVIAV